MQGPFNRGRQRRPMAEINVAGFMDAMLVRSTGRPMRHSSLLGQRIKEKYDGSSVIAGMLRHDRSPQQALEFTPPSALERAAERPWAQRMARSAKDFADTYGDGFRRVYEKIYRAESSTVARIARNSRWLREEFHNATFREPGTRRQDSDRRGPTVFDEIRTEMERAYSELSELLEYTDAAGRTRRHVEPTWMRRWLPMGGRMDKSQAYQEAEAALIDGRKPEGGFQSPEAERLYDGFVQFFRDQRETLNRKGERIRFRQGYTLPVAYSATRIRNLGFEGFADLVRQWAKDPRNRREVHAHFVGLRGDERLEMRDPTDAEIEAYADGLYATLTGLETELDPSEMESEFVSPGFSSSKQRTIPEGLRGALRPVRETDPLTLAYTYATTGAKRGAWRRRFGLRAELDRIDQAYEQARNAADASERRQLMEQARALQQRVMQAYETNYGVNIYDPVARLRVGLIEEYNAGRISEADYKHLTGITLPSYLGTLGADMHEGVRKTQSALITLKNLAILSLSTLAQLVDVGTVLAAMPAGHRAELLGNLRKFGNRADRQEMKRMAQFLGTWQDQSTQHLLNDEVGMLEMSPRLQRLNEWFFRMNGMHAMTNYMRAWATDGALSLFESYAQDFLDADISAAEKQRYRETLKEYNLTEDDVIRWYRDRQANSGSRSTMNLDIDGPHSEVMAAVQQLVNQSVVYPDPTVRPRMGNDQRFALLFHLSGFMFGFAHRIVRRAWNQAKERYGETDGIQKMTAAFPMIMLGAFTLPMAAAGMELRWLIDPPRNQPERGGWDYLWEAVQRTGLLGLAEVAVRMDEAEEYGSFSVLTPFGPTVTSFEQLTKRGVSGLEAWMPARPVIDFVGGWAWSDWRGQGE